MKNTALQDNRGSAARVYSFVQYRHLSLDIREILSYHENRKLEPMPEASVSSFMDGSCSRQLGRYMTDHFACRSLCG